MLLGLKEKATKGVLWNMFEQFGIQGIKFVLGIMLARLLSPSDFGMIGMITVFFDLANVFTDGGLGIAYVQKPKATEEDANTVFFTNLALSTVVYIAFWFAAPVISRFYNQPLLMDIARVMGLVVIINAFGIIQLAQIKRNVDFKRKMKITIFATLVSGTAGVLSAIKGLGAWSLVIQQLLNQLLVTICYAITNKWKPTFKYSVSSLKSMLSVGLWELLSSLVETFFSNIYVLTIGKFFQPAELGYYSRAHQLQAMVSNQLSGTIGSVAFPVLARLQGDKSSLESAMRKFLQYAFFLTVPSMALLFVIAKPFTLIFLTAKWLPMVPYLKLLCLAGFLYPMHVVNLQILTAMGKTRLTFNLAILKGSLRILNIFITIRWGMIYIICGEVIFSMIALVINTIYTKRIVQYGLMRQLKDVAYIILGGAISGVISYFISTSINNALVSLIIGAFLTLSIYLLVELLTNLNLIKSIVGLRTVFFKK